MKKLEQFLKEDTSKFPRVNKFLNLKGLKDIVGFHDALNQLETKYSSFPQDAIESIDDIVGEAIHDGIYECLKKAGFTDAKPASESEAAEINSWVSDRWNFEPLDSEE